jgi:hypothetical protein
MVSDPDPATRPLPRPEYIITSRHGDVGAIHDVAESAHQALHSSSKENDFVEYPEIPRLVVLTPEEAEEMGVPGWTTVDVRVSRSEQTNEGGAWWASGWVDGWRDSSRSRSTERGDWREPRVTVLPGTTVRIPC